MIKYIARPIFLLSALSFSFLSHASGDDWILGFRDPEAYIGRMAELTRAAADQEQAELQALAEIAERVAFTALNEEKEALDEGQARADNCVELPEQECEDVCSSNAENKDPRFKIELCLHYEKHGTCRFGDACQFAHGSKQLRMRHQKFKKQLCKNWRKWGKCRYGNRCSFAHGSTELRK